MDSVAPATALLFTALSFPQLASYIMAAAASDDALEMTCLGRLRRHPHRKLVGLPN